MNLKQARRERQVAELVRRNEADLAAAAAAAAAVAARAAGGDDCAVSCGESGELASASREESDESGARGGSCGGARGGGSGSPGGALAASGIAGGGGGGDGDGRVDDADGSGCPSPASMLLPTPRPATASPTPAATHTAASAHHRPATAGGEEAGTSTAHSRFAPPSRGLGARELELLVASAGMRFAELPGEASTARASRPGSAHAAAAAAAVPSGAGQLRRELSGCRAGGAATVVSTRPRAWRRRWLRRASRPGVRRAEEEEEAQEREEEDVQATEEEVQAAAEEKQAAEEEQATWEEARVEDMEGRATEVVPARRTRRRRRRRGSARGCQAQQQGRGRAAAMLTEAVAPVLAAAAVCFAGSSCSLSWRLSSVRSTRRPRQGAPPVAAVLLRGVTWQVQGTQWEGERER
ncbi:hypothetical protein FOA52_003402 [Chlamydomonas sp. UWO 241]|nr:hypothetical protein FOA52_003402 [Chlamydomonas sp. UWO 241]